jgi:hypothetical protein
MESCEASVGAGLGAVGDRAGHCEAVTYRYCGGGGLTGDGVESTCFRVIGLRVLLPLLRCAGGRWSMVAARSLRSSGMLILVALVQRRPGERAHFPCGEILADTPDGLSVPVIRAGGTGKSRFQVFSLSASDPCAVQDPVLFDPSSRDLVQVPIRCAVSGHAAPSETRCRQDSYDGRLASLRDQ